MKAQHGEIITVINASSGVDIEEERLRHGFRGMQTRKKALQKNLYGE